MDERTDPLTQELMAQARDMSDEKLIAAIVYGQEQSQAAKLIMPQLSEELDKDIEIFRAELEKRNPIYKQWGKQNWHLN
jgi:hypothetical protein